jgi:Glutamate-cysteine ligase
VCDAGQIKTMARWIRDFVASHPSYEQDSVVNEQICYDLVSVCAGVTYGTRDEPTLVFNHKTRSAPTLSSAQQRNEQHLKEMVAKHVSGENVLIRDAGMGDS